MAEPRHGLHWIVAVSIEGGRLTGMFTLMINMIARRSTAVKAVLATLALALLVPLGWTGYEYAMLQVEIAHWDPDRAAADAARDIERGRPKTYLHGSYSAYVVGLDPTERALVAHLPSAEAGVGCIVPSDELFEAQGRYAANYNRAIFAHQAGKAKAL